MLYRDDYIHGDFNINRFIYLVLLFVMSIFLIISTNIWGDLGVDGRTILEWTLKR